MNRVLVRAYRGDVTGASALAKEVSALSTKDPTAIAWALYGAVEALRDDDVVGSACDVIDDPALLAEAGIQQATLARQRRFCR